MASKAFAFGFAALGVALLFACSSQPQPTEKSTAPTPENPVLAKALPTGHRVGPSASVDGAVIYAVLAPGAASETEFLTLDEAMAAKVCTVREVGARVETQPAACEGEASAQQDNSNDEVSGDVNSLLISNTGSKSIFCMAGDLVLGGKQDRILAESLVVAPQTKDMKIPVFCVEHGRWTTQAKDGAEAGNGYFTNTKDCGQVDLNVKKAAMEGREQGKVWEEVARNNDKLGVQGKAESGTFRSTFDDEGVNQKIEKNFLAAQKLLGRDVVGFAVMVKGELVAMDLFESSGLCQKLSDKLLRSYVITGIGGGYESNDTLDKQLLPGSGRDQIEEQTRELESETQGDSSLRVQTGNTQRLNRARPTQPAMGDVNTNPNDNTSNTRVYEKDAMKYDCKDNKSGKFVQRSYMKR